MFIFVFVKLKGKFGELMKLNKISKNNVLKINMKNEISTFYNKTKILKKS